MRVHRIFLALSGVLLTVSGCHTDNYVSLVSPTTGETVTCNGNYGRSSYLVTQFTGNQSAIRQCVATYADHGFVRLN